MLADAGSDLKRCMFFWPCSVQSPYVRLSANDAQMKALREDMESPHGDPFGLLNMFQEWIRIKNSRREASYKWCRRHGLAEQRLYEMAKLQKQFHDILSQTV